MRQTITTKFIGPTNMRGSRYKAVSASGHSYTMSADYSLGLEGNHKLAAMLLAKKLGWSGKWVGGATDKGYCFVLVDDDSSAFIVTKNEPIGVFHAAEYRTLPEHLREKFDTCSCGISPTPCYAERHIQP